MAKRGGGRSRRLETLRQQEAALAERIDEERDALCRDFGAAVVDIFGEGDEAVSFVQAVKASARATSAKAVTDAVAALAHKTTVKRSDTASGTTRQKMTAEAT